MAHTNVIESEEKLAEIIKTVHTTAVIGMKGEAEPEAPAFEIPQAMQKRGIRVIPVNPKLTTALGEKAYASLSAIPDKFDVVQVFRRSEAIPQVADEVLALPAEKRPKVFWMQTGIRNDEAAQKLAEAGIQVVQDRCMSVYSSRYRAKS
jgi:uncharacterized protein